ncbi:MAG: DNA repair protein RadC [Verrucomicrobia bacterium]|nr:DNA repair protein RadC [Verrucomicrobiota bacterium]
MPSTRIQELPPDDRPREKLANHGAASLSDSELIAILLRTGLVGVNVIELARQLLQKFQSLGGLARSSVKELASVKGIGPAKAVHLAAAFGLASRLAKESLSKQKIDSPELVYALLGPSMRALSKESLQIILLDTKLQLIRFEEISLGSINESIAHPRDIFRPAIVFSAYAVILVHNHPSGDPAPSDADRRITHRLNEVATLLQIKFFDHVIIGSPDNHRLPYFSFREAGLL